MISLATTTLAYDLAGYRQLWPMISLATATLAYEMINLFACRSYP